MDIVEALEWAKEHTGICELKIRPLVPVDGTYAKIHCPYPQHYVTDHIDSLCGLFSRFSLHGKFTPNSLKQVAGLREEYETMRSSDDSNLLLRAWIIESWCTRRPQVALWRALVAELIPWAMEHIEITEVVSLSGQLRLLDNCTINDALAAGWKPKITEDMNLMGWLHANRDKDEMLELYEGMLKGDTPLLKGIEELFDEEALIWTMQPLKCPHCGNTKKFEIVVTPVQRVLFTIDENHKYTVIEHSNEEEWQDGTIDSIACVNCQERSSSIDEFGGDHTTLSRLKRSPGSC